MTRWYSEKKKEFYYKEAKRQGYRARSAFKLKQIQKRFHILQDGDIVLDLGAAPGGWSQVATDYVGTHGQIIGIDLQRIEPVIGCIFIQGDVTKEETYQQIREQLPTNRVDVVLSDMSPDISGQYTLDQARSAWLCEQALMVADQFLKPGGHIICKLFEGEDAPSFIEMVKQKFQIVKQFSPQASRKSSSEKYIIGKSFKVSSK